MLTELQKKMEEFQMVMPGDFILAGVSGGADSVCLLILLRELQKKVDFSFEVVHVEHGIRGEESKGDAKYVQDLCKKFQLVCHTVEVDVPAYSKHTGIGIEEAARILRYQVFVNIALEKGAKVALAHHQEDNAETILFQMIRGSSLTGLCGMQPVRKDGNGVFFIRPLLFFCREEIESYLKTKGVEWREDSTNVDLNYSRNFLRSEVIPKMTQINAQAVVHMNQVASHLSEVKEYLDIETETKWSEIAKEGDEITLKIPSLLCLHSVLQRQLVYKAVTLVASAKKDITSTHIEDVLALCKGQSGKRIHLPYGITASKEFDFLHLKVFKNEIEAKKVYEVSLEDLNRLHSEESFVLPIGDGAEKLIFRVFEKEESNEIPRKTYTKWFDYDKIKKGFCIRTRRNGDYFINDVKGHHKKLKEYFIDEKIPLKARDQVWLLADQSEVFWIIGGRVNERVKVSQKTRYVLEITYDGGTQNE